MKRLIKLYPKRWRDRYGAELEAFLDREPRSLGVFFDLLRGVIDAHLRPTAPLGQFAFAAADRGRTFQPEVGFRHAGTKLARPVRCEQGQRSLTVANVMCTPSGVDVEYEFTVPSAELTPRSRTIPDPETVTLRVGGREHATQFVRRSSRNESTSDVGRLVRTMLLRPEPALPAGLSGMELRLDGDTFGSWSVEVALVPFPSDREAEAVPINGTDTQHGITVAVRSVAVGEDTTAVELTGSVDGGRLHGIGGLLGRRAGTTALTLRDQSGRIYAERPQGRPGRDDFRGSPHAGTVALFDRLPDDASQLELEVPFICVDEMEYRAVIDLPVSAPIVVAMGPYQLRALASREVESTDPFEPGPAIAVDLDLGDWKDDRRILTFAGPLSIDGAYPGGSLRGPSKGPAEPAPVTHLEVPLKEPSAARQLTLCGVTVQVRGPWRIRFTREAVS